MSTTDLSTGAEAPSTVGEADAAGLDLVDEPFEYGLLTKLGAEAFGTFVLVLFGVGTALWANISGVAGAGLAVPLGFGIAVIGAASAVGHISGGHFNPAVTFGAAIAQRTRWAHVLPYWIAQIVGGTVAAAFLFLLIPGGMPALFGQADARGLFSTTSTGFGEHSPVYTTIAASLDSAVAETATFQLPAALLIEIIGTAVFVGVILGVTSKRAKLTYAPVAIGLTLAAVLALLVPFTNGSVNPARSLATAFFSDTWALQQVWLFWVAPLIGAAIAGLIALLAAGAPTAVKPSADAGTEGAWNDMVAEESTAPSAATAAASATAAAGSAAGAESGSVSGAFTPNADAAEIDAMLARRAADAAATEAAAAEAAAEEADDAAAAAEVVAKAAELEAEDAAVEAAAAEATAEDTEGDEGGQPRA
ncbi:aquaporin [Serinibacter salmoneus]|uniref:Aquaporin Z n=1 Tax=Serinibacter salmoneus TaxID=556530 RepID=A0A2A9CX78_9MICO|nr:aquaporin [Serinibacter salmoneus]PFG19034.1 aquaporin Z [Serinibacter salmoneus]